MLRHFIYQENGKVCSDGTHSTYTHTDRHDAHPQTPRPLHAQSVGVNKYVLVHVGIGDSDKGSKQKKRYLYYIPVAFT